MFCGAESARCQYPSAIDSSGRQRCRHTPVRDVKTGSPPAYPPVDIAPVFLSRVDVDAVEAIGNPANVVRLPTKR